MLFQKSLSLQELASIELSLIDKNNLFNKDKILGSFEIPVLSKLMNKNWQKMKHKPIETYLVKKQDKKTIFGRAKLFLEVFKEEEIDEFPLYRLMRYDG